MTSVEKCSTGDETKHMNVPHASDCKVWLWLPGSYMLWRA
jgi:hypothetical protein